MYTNVAVWISESMTDGLARSLFSQDNGASKFRNDFDIDNQSDFFDEEHLIILYPEISGEESIEDVGSDYLDRDFWSKVIGKLKKINASKVNYVLAVPDFKYSGKKKEVDGVVFLGNFKYVESDNDVLKYFSDGF